MAEKKFKYIYHPSKRFGIEPTVKVRIYLNIGLLVNIQIYNPLKI